MLRSVKSTDILTKAQTQELTTYWNKWSGYWQKAKRRQERSVRQLRSQTEELVVNATRHTHPHSGSGSVHKRVFQPPLLQHNMIFTKPNITDQNKLVDFSCCPNECYRFKSCITDYVKYFVLTLSRLNYCKYFLEYFIQETKSDDHCKNTN